jgi:hypothetical protein
MVRQSLGQFAKVPGIAEPFAIHPGLVRTYESKIRLRLNAMPRQVGE